MLSTLTLSVVFLVLVDPLMAGESELPRVEPCCEAVKSEGYLDRRLRDIVPPQSVTRIALTHRTSSADDSDYDAIINRLFASHQVSSEWGLRATEAVWLEYVLVTDNSFFVLNVYGNFGHGPVTGAVLQGRDFNCRFDMDTGIDQLAERIVVDSSVESAGSLGTSPARDRSFQKRIEELRGRRIRDIVDCAQIQKIVKPRPFVSKNGVRVVDLSNDLIMSALQTGRIVDQSDLHFHLQFSRECVVQLPAGPITIGIHYEPVGYIRCADDESYWFLFGDQSAARPTGDRQRAEP